MADNDAKILTELYRTQKVIDHLYERLQYLGVLIDRRINNI